MVSTYDWGLLSKICEICFENILVRVMALQLYQSMQWELDGPMQRLHKQIVDRKVINHRKRSGDVTIQNGWNNRISDGCVYAQIRRGLGMHLVTYSNHDTVLFLLIVPIKGRFVWDGIHCIYIYQRLHVFLILLEYLGNLVRFSIYKGWNFPFLLGDILNIPLKGSI